MSKRIWMVVAVIFLVGGCAGTNQQSVLWVPKDKNPTPEIFKSDNFDCSQQSRTYWSGGGTGLVGAAMIVTSASIADQQAKNIYFRCMESKGYVAEDKVSFTNKAERMKKLASGNPAAIGAFVSLADTAPPKILSVVPDGPAEKAGLKKVI